MLNISSSSACLPPLTSSNSFDLEVLPVEESSDNEDDGSFKLDCGFKSGDDSGDDSTPELAQISNNDLEVHASGQHFSCNLKYLPNTFAACQLGKDMGTGYPPWVVGMGTYGYG